MNACMDDIYPQWRLGLDLVSRLDKVFICGCPKSGTTWIWNLLNGHDEIVVDGEGCFTYQLLPLLGQAFQVFNQHQKDMAPVTHLRDVDLALIGRTMIDSQLARYISQSGKDTSRVLVVGDKTPQHTVSLATLGQLYPAAKFVHIVRDPRDVATSAWFHFGKNEQRSFEEFVRYMITEVWPINVGGARRAAPQLGGRYREIRYEDLHADEPGLVGGLLEFLAVDSSETAVNNCLEAGSFKHRSGGRERGQTDSNSFYRSGTAGDWRNHIPAELAESCCAATADLMIECGYDSHCAVVVT